VPGKLKVYGKRVWRVIEVENVLLCDVHLYVNLTAKCRYGNSRNGEKSVTEGLEVVAFVGVELSEGPVNKGVNLEEVAVDELEPFAGLLLSLALLMVA
jgi:hypothetical protein